MAEKKFYVVWKGRTPGIYENWGDCNKQITGFAGAEFMAFKSRELAQKALQGNPSDYFAQKESKPVIAPTSDDIKKFGLPIYESIAVDAACNMAKKIMEYQGVDARTGKLLFHQGPFEGGTNNVGEYLAIVHALALCKQMNLKIPIYSDSVTALAWLRNKGHKSELERTAKNAKLFELLDRADKWLQTNTWENKVLKWHTQAWGEVPADFGRK
jgi:ribonuclease HI